MSHQLSAIIVTEAAIVGAIVGSFATNTGIRLSRRQPWWKGRSRCDHCHRQLSYVETTPLLGFVLKRGRCDCGRQILFRHVAGEIIGGASLPTLLVWATPMMTIVVELLLLSLWAAWLGSLRPNRKAP